MAERSLNVNQQIALLPAFIPDSILDFLENFHLPTALSSEQGRGAYDPEFLKSHGEQLKRDIEALCQGAGAFRELKVDPAGKDIPNGYILRLGFENGVRGAALLTSARERLIRSVFVQPGTFSEPELREHLKSLPK